MSAKRAYEGVDKDPGVITPTANIVRDAWVFGLIPETETCEGWNVQRLEGLYDRVTQAWAPYGHLVSRLPPELAERHARIYDAALARARAQGWEPPMEEE